MQMGTGGAAGLAYLADGLALAHAIAFVHQDGGGVEEGAVEAVAVIDPGGSLHTGRLLHTAVRDRTDLPIRYVVLTHIHPDHCSEDTLKHINKNIPIFDRMYI